MYVGRTLAIALNSDGSPILLYRVASKSFYERKCVIDEEGISVFLNDKSEVKKSPYVYYRCASIIR
jgi:IMP cyclohydrolase